LESLLYAGASIRDRLSPYSCTMFGLSFTQWFATPIDKTPRKISIFWFCLALTFAGFYGFLGWKEAFSAEYMVQDDARQHVFWMARFLDRDLFPNDLIADYFQSVAPLGYQGFYWFFAQLGIDPILLHKILPFFLGLVATAFAFGVTLELFPIPVAAFSSTLLLNQSLWMQDGLISATPKAFIYPLFLAFLYYWLRRHLLGVAVAIALLGLFYPQGILIATGIFVLSLFSYQSNKLKISLNFSNCRLSFIGFFVAFLILLPYLFAVSESDPTISLTQAKQWPEFLENGRTKFFVNDAWAFWLHGRSGIGLSAALTPILTVMGFFLPVFLAFPRRFPLAVCVRNSRIFLDLAIASLGLFILAHLTLFSLHLPSRYTQHSLRLILTIAAGIGWVIVFDALWHWTGDRPVKKRFLTLIITLFSLVFLTYPQWAMSNFPWTYYQIGEQPKLYQFFQDRPKDILIASISEEANNLPTFSRRSILTSREYAIPFHLGYYQRLRDRTNALIEAQYSPNLSTIQEFVKRYKIDFWLVDKGAFTPGYLAYNRWLVQYPATREAIADLEKGVIPVLSTLFDRCGVFENEGAIVLQGQCLLNEKEATIGINSLFQSQLFADFSGQNKE
jgi:hypothetical protein